MITARDLGIAARKFNAAPISQMLGVATDLAMLVLAYEEQCDRQASEAIAEARRRWPEKWAEYDEIELEAGK